MGRRSGIYQDKHILNVPEEFLLMKTSTSRILQENIARGSSRGRFIYSLRMASIYIRADGQKDNYY